MKRGLKMHSDDFFNNFDKEQKQMMKTGLKFGCLAVIINLAMVLAAVAGICWIVKYFFFS